jgi:hypothetical protein
MHTGAAEAGLEFFLTDDSFSVGVNETADLPLRRVD